MLAATCGCLYFATSANALAAAVDPQMQLSMVLAEVQQNLAVAEKHQHKALKKTKKAWSTLLSAKASLLATAIKQYGDVLTSAANGLKETAASTKLALEKVADNSNGTDWTVIQQRAALGAKVAATESESARLTRKRDGQLADAVRRAKEPLEDSAGMLTRKLGDLSEVLDKANAVLDDAAQAQPSAAMAAVSTKKENTTSVSKARADLAALHNALDASKTAAKAQVLAAEKQFAATLKGVTADVSAETAKLKRELEEAERTEMQKLHPAKVNVGVKAADHLRVHAKVASKKH